MSRKHQLIWEAEGDAKKSTRSNFRSREMSDDDMMQVDDEDVVPIRSKGKGKAVENVDGDDNLPWVEKYRPQSLDEVVSHNDIISTIDRFIERKKLPHLLFYGPPGTGKTSTILAVARKIYGKNYKQMILELNASDDRGIDVVREQIKTFASTRQIFSSAFKLIILDEADAMTLQAQNALRRIIEKYTRNVRFCIICNYINKLSPAIQSRTTKFRFSPLSTPSISARLDHIIESESVNITSAGKEALLKLSNGDMRRAVNVLQACSSAYDQIDEEEVYMCVGMIMPADTERIVQSMLSEEFGSCLKSIITLRSTDGIAINTMRIQKGLALQDILGAVYEAMQDLELVPQTRIMILDLLATIEHRLSMGGTERIQVSAMVAGIKTAIDLGAQ